MALDKFEKQPYEVFWISVSFANDYGASEAIVMASSTVTATDTDGADATATVIVANTASANGPQGMKVQVKAGDESGSPYKITFRSVTDSVPANKWEKDVQMKVKEL